MDFKAPKHNTPAATLIRNYDNKKSGKVTVSRREIKQRFNGMDWVHQKKILLAFINAGAADREWASRKMFAFWDNSFIPVVKSLWEKYHEMSLSWLILRYFPKDYLKQNMDSLSQGRNYYYLCQRLIDEPNFCVDKKRLYESDLIELFKISKKKVSDEEIAEIFLSMIGKICRGEYKSSRMYNWSKDEFGEYEWSILSNGMVSCILFDIEHFLSKEKLAKAIRKWNFRIMKEVVDSNEYRMINRMEDQKLEVQSMYIDLIKKHYRKHLSLDDIYMGDDTSGLMPYGEITKSTIDAVSQYSILEQMQAEIPIVNKLVDSFSLELDGH